MKEVTFDLVQSSEESDIKYEISQFPDGQQNITITNFRFGMPLLMSNNNYKVLIKSRFNSFKDLELIVAATKCLRNLGVEIIDLYIPYLLGARSDRKFVSGGNSYLRDVIAPIINSLNYKRVISIDAHSHVAQAVIPNLVVRDNSDLVRWAIDEISIKDFVIIAPDAGAQHKIFDLAKKLQLTNKIVCCNKERDLATGSIIKTEVPGLVDIQTDNFIIIDDICSRGGTFAAIADAIVKIKPNSKITLIVTHYEGTADVEWLVSKGIEDCFTTNSIRDIKQGDFLHQLNIF